MTGQTDAPRSCRDVAGRLAAVAAGEAVLAPRERDHVQQCLRCQAEVVQHRRILRSMRSLRDELIEPAPGLLASVLGELHDRGERRAVQELLNRRRIAYGAAIAALAAAAVVGAAATRRSRRGRVAAGAG